MASKLEDEVLLSSSISSSFVISIMISLLLLLSVANGAESSTNIRKLSIGFVYCDSADLHKAERSVSRLNTNENIKYFSKIKYNLEIKSLKLKENDNPVSLSLSVCQDLMQHANPIYAVIIANTSCLRSKSAGKSIDEQDFILTLSAISFTCAYYQIPVIDLQNRESVFSDKNIHSSLIRMSPPYFHQASIWIELIKDFDWKSVNLIYCSDHEGKMLASRFQLLADLNEIKISNEVEYVKGIDNYTDIIQSLVKSTSRVFLLQAKQTDIEKILNEAEKADLMKTGNVWIVCDEILRDLNGALSKNGILIGEYVEDTDLIHYSLAILKKTFEYYGPVVLKPPARNCSENGLDWPSGKKAYEDIVLNSHQIDDKLIEFDEDGDRVSTRFKIINVVENSLEIVGEYTSSLKSNRLNLNKTKIVWPGSSKQRPDGTKWSANFKVVVIEEKPFIFKIANPKNLDCSIIYNNSYSCPWSYKNSSANYCCYGYCIDLIKTLSEKLKFEFELYLVPDGLYGDYDIKQGWNGLMGELLSDRADLILAPFTINPERAAAADFTKPFKYQGITILVQRKGSESSLVSFLQPFKDGLWIMVLLSVHVVAVVLYLLDRFSPFGKFKQSKTENTEEDALNLSRAVWFTWGVLLNSGIGEGTPRSFSARVLGMVWAGFAMIMVASYTANLAAFLVLDRPEAGISGINDARLRNPSENYSYASVKGSAVERYFKRQVELSTMYRTMENKNYETADEAIEGLKAGKIQAFIWDSARLEYEARQSCDFITTGELFGRSSYGMALKKGNPWLHKLSLEILTLHENGDMEDLDKNWILLNNTNCVTKDSSPSTLGLTNMAGVFMLVAGGVIAGIFLIFVEIAYKKRKDKKVREHDLSRNAFATWRKNIEKRKLRNARNSIDNQTKLDQSFSNSLTAIAMQKDDTPTSQTNKVNKQLVRFESFSTPKSQTSTESTKPSIDKTKLSTTTINSSNTKSSLANKSILLKSHLNSNPKGTASDQSPSTSTYRPQIPRTLKLSNETTTSSKL